MLYQMMLHNTGEPFRAAQLQASPKAPQYFSTDCNHSPLCGILYQISSGSLKKGPTLFAWPIKARFDELGIVISDEDATATVSLIGRCLELNPAHPSAAELLSDPWFDGVE